MHPLSVDENIKNTVMKQFDIAVLVVLLEKNQAYESFLATMKEKFQTVYFCTSTSEAIKTIKEENGETINLVITDVYTQGNDTFDMLSALRHYTPKMLAVIMTPLADNRIFDYINGIDKKNSYIKDPVEWAEFDRAVQESMKKFQRFQISEKAEFLLMQYKFAMDQIAQVINVDTHGKIKKANNNFFSKTGFCKDDVVGNDIQNLICQNENDNKFREIWKQVSSRKYWHGVCSNKDAGGDNIYANLHAMPLIDKNGNIMEYLIVLHDITDHVISTINANNSEKAKDAFLANTSHEIRTPLNGIVGYTQLLSNLDLPPKAKEYVETISLSSKQLLDLINEILDLSKIQSGHLKVSPEWVDLAHEMDVIQKMFVVNAQKRGIELCFEIDEKLQRFVKIDGLRFKQIMVNLISNAVKFSYSKVSVKMRHLQTDTETTRFVVEISDNGIGIAKEKQEKIFQPFTQENTDVCKNFGGTGLGLTIVNELLSMMHSKIKLNSQLHVGSTFEFSLTLPYKEDNIFMSSYNEQPAAADKVKKSFQLNNSVKVLVAEDNKINQMLITDVFKAMGIEIELCENGQNAIDAVFKNDNYDIIFMDIDMPVMDGVAATGQIKEYLQKHDRKDIPIIALTANVYQEDRKKYIEAGMANILSKPFEIHELETILKQHLDEDKIHYSQNKEQYSEYGQNAQKIGISEEKYRVYIQKYIDSVKQDISKMYACINADDFDSLRKLLHKHKGTAGILQLSSIFEHLTYLERAAKNKENLAWEEEIEQFEEKLF